ncbi:hypothetical protein [aff. Roholtiella sp. LEGE 12411]|uniref:hypothetical protein n=1 Tax=aff. Roholtiella sp. LEGE 12411 TaxID=1828822 RepID=UPI00188245FF|nr:hypothetical protein [aff. Roholtiella sp. LEGE 12411]MBE9036999.1 hypothetical protein [aff. Roholtiella sp. LEGE 12411]
MLNFTQNQLRFLILVQSQDDRKNKLKDTKVTQPVGYFSLSHDNPLIKDMCETWGEGLEKMNESDAFWLISRIAHEAWTMGDFSVAPSDEAEDVWKRLHELKQWEKLALIRAIAQ